MTASDQIARRVGTRAGRLVGLAVIAVCAGLLSACTARDQPPADGRTPVWIDTDVAIGEPERRVDDGVALLQAFHSPSVGVRGVSAVFGEAPLVRTWPITQDLVERFGAASLRPTRGAAGPHERSAPTEATEALATALREERLTIVALGPWTNIASLLSRDPDLAGRIVRLVAVAGRRADQTGAGANQRGGELNVALDVEAVRQVLASDVPISLVAGDQPAGMAITDADLARLAEGPVAARFLAESARDWLRLWRQASGEDGFAPVSALAVDLVANPERIACVDAAATLEPAGDLRDADAGPAPPQDTLIVRPGASGRPVSFCGAPDAAFKERLMTTLLREP